MRARLFAFLCERFAIYEVGCYIRMSFRKQKGRRPISMAAYSACCVAVLLLASVGTLARAQPAKVFVNSAVLAIGERATLLDLKSQRIVSSGESFDPDLRFRPGSEPRKVSEFQCELFRDVETGRLRYEWQRKDLYPFEEAWNYTEVVNGLEGVVLGADGYDRPSRRAMSASRVAARQKEIGRSPVSVLIQALSRADSFLRLMDQVVDGRRQVVVSYNANAQLVVLAIDADTRLLTKVAFVEDDPLLGDVRNEVYFDDWRLVGRLKLPFERTYWVNGQKVRVERVHLIQNDFDLSHVDFTIPETIEQSQEWNGERGEFSSHWVLRQAARGNLIDNPPYDIELREIAPGVMHVLGGAYRSLVIEMADYLIVVEAPGDDLRSRSVLKILNNKFPTKKVRFVINTHFHSDHAGGLRTYVAADAIVVTSSINLELFQNAFRTLHTRVPDALQRRPRIAVFEGVDDGRKFFVDENRVVIVVPIETEHVAGMLAVYLPEEEILFVSDLFSPGSVRQVQTWVEDVSYAIESKNLRVGTIVGSKGGIGTIEELRQFVPTTRR